MSLSYIKSTLADGEEVLGQLKITKLQYLWPIISLPILIGIPWLLSVFISRATTEMAYTNKRIILKTGIISRDTDEIRIDRIESVDIKQSIFGRMLGFGTIYVTGTGAKIIVLDAVANVIEIRKALVSVSDEVRG
jgi:uncharacterized membrane protein YdbT with pleckstrin-like domain|tara:strand:- start:1433 stop:1837 length:405 start_codon:yes stop_codon:yes gene_type:complete